MLTVNWWNERIPDNKYRAESSAVHCRCELRHIHGRLQVGEYWTRADEPKKFDIVPNFFALILISTQNPQYHKKNNEFERSKK